MFDEFKLQWSGIDLNDLSGNRFATHLACELPMSEWATAQKKPFPFTARARPMTEQPRRQNARVVQHEQVARPKQSRQFSKPTVMDRRPSSIHNQQSARVARFGRMLSNETERQFEIEKRHTGILSLATRSPLAARARRHKSVSV